MTHIFKHTIFKYTLLVMLSFKAGYFVYENVSGLFHAETISYTIDLDDFENENEDKNEFDESEKIHQKHINTDLSIESIYKSRADKLSENYRYLYFEFTTPPPELS